LSSFLHYNKGYLGIFLNKKDRFHVGAFKEQCSFLDGIVEMMNIEGGFALHMFSLPSTLIILLFVGRREGIYYILTIMNIFQVFFSVLVAAFAFGYSIPIVGEISQAIGSGSNVFEILDEVPEIDPYHEGGLIMSTVFGAIEFKNVRFRYPTRTDVQVSIQR
jgi:ATP-binding cassette subfamily B (MDR/TAP) protein 1